MKYFKSYIENCECCEDCSKPKYSLKESNISENLKYHIDNNIYLSENLFRVGSENYFQLINEARELWKNGLLELNPINEELIKTDLGLKGVYEGEEVWLDCPIQEGLYIDDNGMINEAEYRGKKVKLNKPKRGGSKAYYVYVKNDKGNVIKVSFGSGMRAKINDPDARDRYNKRHGCSKGKHNNKENAGYWSCRLPRYAKSLGLFYSGSAKWW